MLKKMMSKKYLFIRITLGFVFGIIIGIAAPRLALATEFLGTIYLNGIQMMIVPIIFASVSTGIISMRDGRELGRVGMKTVALFIVNLIVSSLIAYGVASLIRPGRGVSLASAPVFEGELANPSLIGFVTSIVPKNILLAMTEGNILAVILFTALFGMAVITVGEPAKPVKDFVNSLSQVLFKVLGIIMEFSPLGIASLMAVAVTQYGAGIFSALGMYILTAYIACIVVIILVIILPTVLVTGISPLTILKGMYPISLMTLSTTSSAASLPTSIQVGEGHFKVPKEISRFILPLGTTIHMVGGSVSFACLTVFVADFYGLSLSWQQIAFGMFVSLLLNMGAPGIPGGGIILGATYLSIVGLPFALMGPIAAVYRLLDMAFTTTNMLSDIQANLIIAKSEGIWDASMVDKPLPQIIEQESRIS